MNIEEAIQTLKDFGMYGRYYSNNTEHHMKTAINIVLNHLTKQEKMIELMAEELAFGVFDFKNKKQAKQYFEKKAEEVE